MSEVEDKTSKLLQKLWEKNRPIVEERLATLNRASTEAEAGQISNDLRKEAAQAAHKLAGALGMYGYEEGTCIAREIDALLSSDVREIEPLQGLVARLRAAVFPGEPA